MALIAAAGAINAPNNLKSVLKKFPIVFPIKDVTELNDPKLTIKAMEATKNNVTSFSLILKKPTISPKIARTGTTHHGIVAEFAYISEIRTAIIKPPKKAHPPNLSFIFLIITLVWEPITRICNS